MDPEDLSIILESHEYKYRVSPKYLDVQECQPCTEPPD
jgi:hypothetical protein